jgi:CRP-like cAMP-binding protein
MELPQALRYNYLFRGLSDAHLDEIMALTSSKTFHGGDTILRQFGRDNDLMVVLKGAAVIKTFSGDALIEIGPGMVLGEVSLIDTEPRSATVVAKGECDVAIIPAEAIQNMMRHNIEIRCVLMENLAKVLCARLRTANVQLDGAMASTAAR